MEQKIQQKKLSVGRLILTILFVMAIIALFVMPQIDTTKWIGCIILSVVYIGAWCWPLLKKIGNWFEELGEFIEGPMDN